MRNPPHGRTSGKCSNISLVDASTALGRPALLATEDVSEVFTYNPFAEMSAFIPPAVMQGYVFWPWLRPFWARYSTCCTNEAQSIFQNAKKAEANAVRR